MTFTASGPMAPAPPSTFPGAADGSFAAWAPTAGALAAAYRVDYIDPATSIPYAAIVGANG